MDDTSRDIAEETSESTRPERSDDIDELGAVLARRKKPGGRPSSARQLLERLRTIDQPEPRPARADARTAASPTSAGTPTTGRPADLAGGDSGGKTGDADAETSAAPAARSDTRERSSVADPDHVASIVDDASAEVDDLIDALADMEPREKRTPPPDEGEDPDALLAEVERLEAEVDEGSEPSGDEDAESKASATEPSGSAVSPRRTPEPTVEPSAFESQSFAPDPPEASFERMVKPPAPAEETEPVGEESGSVVMDDPGADEPFVEALEPEAEIRDDERDRTDGAETTADAPVEELDADGATASAETTIEADGATASAETTIKKVSIRDDTRPAESGGDADGDPPPARVEATSGEKGGESGGPAGEEAAAEAEATEAPVAEEASPERSVARMPAGGEQAAKQPVADADGPIADEPEPIPEAKADPAAEPREAAAESKEVAVKGGDPEPAAETDSALREEASGRARDRSSRESGSERPPTEDALARGKTPAQEAALRSAVSEALASDPQVLRDIDEALAEDVEQLLKGSFESVSDVLENVFEEREDADADAADDDDALQMLMDEEEALEEEAKPPKEAAGRSARDASPKEEPSDAEADRSEPEAAKTTSTGEGLGAEEATTPAEDEPETSASGRDADAKTEPGADATPSEEANAPGTAGSTEPAAPQTASAPEEAAAPAVERMDEEAGGESPSELDHMFEEASFDCVEAVIGSEDLQQGSDLDITTLEGEVHSGERATAAEPSGAAVSSAGKGESAHGSSATTAAAAGKRNPVEAAKRREPAEAVEVISSDESVDVEIGLIHQLPVLQKILTTMNAPLWRLPPRVRMVVDWVALTLVFWVPIVWILAVFVV